MTIGKKDISEALYLSCVENYFLAWIGKFYDVAKLYANSFVSIGQVFDDFFCGARYENYFAVERIQNLAERYGVVRRVFFRMSAEEALEKVRNAKDNDLWLMRVKESFFNDYKRKAWRADHYVCVDRELRWLNQYPLSEGTFDKDKFSAVFDGAMCVFSPGDLAIVPEDENRKRMREQTWSPVNVEIGLHNLESAVGILRVTRKRLEKYYADNLPVNYLLKREAAILDKLYFDVRFQQLKKTKPDDVLYEKVRDIVEIEKEIAEILK